MTIAIAHISDLHLKGQQTVSAAQAREMARSLCAYPASVTDLVLAVTGDITFSGKRAEYDAALAVLGEWRHTAEAAGMSVHVVVVPGNHDCDFALTSGARDALIGCVKAQTAKADASVVTLCCIVQSEYQMFARKIGVPDDIVSALCTTGYACQVVKTEGGEIALHLLNTAWCSQLDEQPGGLIVPSLAIQGLRRVGGTCCEVALMHHSLQWLEPGNAREVRATLDRVTDFVFTGHDHIAALRSSTDITKGLSTILSEGAVLFEGSGSLAGGYSVLLVDPASRRYAFDRRTWVQDHYHSEATEVEWRILTPETKDGRGRFVLRPSWTETLADPGATYRHPRVQHLRMADIYVAPDLQEIVDDNRQRFSSTVLSFDLDGPCHVLLTGLSLSGKTSLCYRVIEDSYRAGLVPVYVNANNTRVKDMSSLERLLEKSFSEQYIDADVDLWRQLPKKDAVVVIDNVHRFPLNAKYRQKLLSNICTRYPKVMLTGDPMLAIEEWSVSAPEPVPEGAASAIRKVQLLPFSNVHRSDLITRWIELGQKESITHQDLTREHDELKLTMDSVLGKNLIPSYPMFLLTILQSYDDEIPHDIQSSAYGYYYEYLITRALRGIVKRNEEVDAYYNYITELAFHLFRAHVRSVTLRQLEAFHTGYCDAYKIRPSMSDMTTRLVKAEILSEKEGAYRFRYPYVYYFFLARYLAHHITEPQIRGCISKMCARVYQDEFSNVIIFLTHLSKDPFILEQVVTTAKAVFPGEETEQFERPNMALLALLDEAPDLMLRDKDVGAERRKALEARDKIEPPEAGAEVGLDEIRYDIEEEIKDPDSIEHFIMSIKVVRLLGQILRNYYGSLKAEPKLMLAEEAYLLSFRAIHRFYAKLTVDINELTHHLGQLVLNKDWDEDRKLRWARRTLFYVSVFIPDIYMHEVAGAVATRHLAETFEQVRTKLASPGARLLDIAIKIACQQAFPIEDAASLARDVKGDLIASLLLKCAVMQHLYLFPRTESERQAICDRLGIPVEERKRLIPASR
ncbi:MAG: metallophosphoesterase [Kiritimatiellae bacterium]|nr:metallophosphoesterase [Kiritimatiellia bacterium]